VPKNDYSYEAKQFGVTSWLPYSWKVPMLRGGMRTHNLSRRAAADLRPRKRGHLDLLLHLLNENTQKVQMAIITE